MKWFNTDAKKFKGNIDGCIEAHHRWDVFNKQNGKIRTKQAATFASDLQFRTNHYEAVTAAMDNIVLDAVTDGDEGVVG